MITAARSTTAATTRAVQPVQRQPSPPDSLRDLLGPHVAAICLAAQQAALDKLERELDDARATAEEEPLLRAEVDKSRAAQDQKLIELMDRLDKEDVVENVEQALEDLGNLVDREEDAEKERQRLLCIVGQTTGESVDTFEGAISALDDYPHTTDDIVSAVSTLANSPLVDDLEAAREWLVEAARRKDWEDIQRMAAVREPVLPAWLESAAPPAPQTVPLAPPAPVQVKCLHPCPNKPTTTARVGTVVRDVCESCKRKVDERAARRQATLPL